MPYYFVRVNGETAHNDPNSQNCYVKNEPPFYPANYFNYYQYCLDNNIVRIGWPDVGDLLIGNKANALANCYQWNTLEDRKRDYLTSFSQLPITSIILMPKSLFEK